MLLVVPNKEKIQEIPDHSSLQIYSYDSRKKIEFRESSYMNEDDLAARQGHVSNHFPNIHISDQKDPRNDNGTKSATTCNTYKSLISQDMLDWRQRNIIKIGPGLVNLGNTCFLNSVLQCLTYIPVFSNYLLSQNHTKFCQTKTICIFCEVEKHVNTCLSHRNSHTVCPKGIVSNINCIAKHFKFGRQEDSHEFLRFLLDIMQRNENLVEKPLSSSIIHQIFGGEFQSKVTCTKCLYASCTIDTFMDICLDIRHANSLDKAFQLFVSPEKLTKDNSYRCSKCNHMVNAEKCLSIHSSPLVLTIQLKRFAYNPHGIGDTKLNKILSFPETLNLEPYTSDSRNRSLVYEYQLQAVLVHSGLSCHSGHYYSFVKGPNDIWYSMNDSFVHPVGISTVLRQPAYLLFYMQKIKHKMDNFTVNEIDTNQTHNDHKRIVHKISSWIEKPRTITEEKVLISSNDTTVSTFCEKNELDKPPDGHDMEYDMGRVKKIKRRHINPTPKSNPFQNATEMIELLKNSKRTSSEECIYFK